MRERKNKNKNPSKIKVLWNRIFPKNKEFNQLEAPIQNLLTTKFFLGFLAVVGMIALLFLKWDWQLKALGEGLLFVYVLTLVHVWWLFITDSVCWLEATYLGRSEADESENVLLKASTKLRHRFVSRKVYLLKDNVKYEVCVRTYDSSISKGDVVRIYTTPNNVLTKSDGVVRINSILSLYVVKAENKNLETKTESE